MNKPLVLVGFMGCGKSTVGRLFAERRGWRFVDTDSWIERRADKPIRRIFAEDGEPRFREMERALLPTLLAESGIVIATGGGLPCHSGNMALIKQSAVSAFLSVPAETLLRRLRSETAQRPLLAEKTDAELLPWMRSKLVARLPFYQQAAATVEADAPLEEVLRRLGECC